MIFIIALMAGRGLHRYLLALSLSNTHASGCCRLRECSDVNPDSVHSRMMLGELLTMGDGDSWKSFSTGLTTGT